MVDLAVFVPVDFLLPVVLQFDQVAPGRSAGAKGLVARAIGFVPAVLGADLGDQLFVKGITGRLGK